MLDTGFVLDLHNVFLVPEISRNLISVSKLIHEGFEFIFGQNLMRISRNECLIGNGYLCGGLYRLQLNSLDERSLHTPHISYELSIGTKRGAIKENSSVL